MRNVRSNRQAEKALLSASRRPGRSPHHPFPPSPNASTLPATDQEGTTHRTDRRERYRELVIHGSQCLHPGSVFDAVSARIAEDLGFRVGMFAGSIGSFAVLGNPDLILLTLTEFAAQAYRINRAGKLPLMVDADHGYGNALNVMRTVQELETAGVAGIMIEDTACRAPSASPSRALISIEEGVGKMRAALSGP